MSPSEFRRFNRIIILLIVFFPAIAIVVGVFNLENNLVLFASVLAFYALVNLAKHFLTKSYIKTNAPVSRELKTGQINPIFISSVLLIIFVLYLVFTPFNIIEFIMCSLTLILLILVPVILRNYEFHIDEQGVELEDFTRMSIDWKEISKIEIINSELRLTIKDKTKVFEIPFSQIERLKKILNSANQEFFLSE